MAGFEKTFLNVSENAKKVEICVSISQPSNALIEIQPFNLTVKTQAGTAGELYLQISQEIPQHLYFWKSFVLSSDSQDLLPINQTLEGFGNITRRQCVNVNITDDAVHEDAETFTATLEKTFNGNLPKILIHPAMVTVTILDNDGKDI